ncbi:MAG: L-serine dehydratase [marine bacterium B5-7]|nr:MAG: L-serine dehydratase [marine bacterium B5-7]
MAVSIFDLFSIGLGPSSSHSIGPMYAALDFVQQRPLSQVKRIQVDLYGSLALTGKGHGTDKAVLLGLMGEEPESVDPNSVDAKLNAIANNKQLALNAQHIIPFNIEHDVLFHMTESLPHHSNGMRFTAFDAKNDSIASQIYYSVGGGFIIKEQDIDKPQDHSITLPYPFDTGDELLALCEQHQLSIAEIMMENEKMWHSEQDIRSRLQLIANTMHDCIERGVYADDSTRLPGGLNVRRRAPALFTKLTEKGRPNSHEHTDSIDWLNLYAIAVNEENAAGGRVVTAPTNGAAGIIPAVLHFYLHFHPEHQHDDIITFLLTAGAIAILYKKGASISGAEVGCQGEVGVAASMAAAALAAVRGGTVLQIENAAEIAMEHHLGLTCDPVAGLVQIPCIERNAMGAIKAVNASRLALLESGEHHVSLDKVIKTMRDTGRDMMSIYKETSLGGLAVNVIEC